MLLKQVITSMQTLVGLRTVIEPADDVDPEYGRLLRRAAAAGVLVMALAHRPSTTGIPASGSLPTLPGRAI